MLIAPRGTSQSIPKGPGGPRNPADMDWNKIHRVMTVPFSKESRSLTSDSLRFLSYKMERFHLTGLLWGVNGIRWRMSKTYPRAP